MKGFDFLNTPSVFIEIGQDSLKALHENNGIELPLERQSSGRLTDACRERVIAGIKAFLKRSEWQPRVRAHCAIGARGVSLRRFTLPATPKGELERLVRMQIENELPLSPDELAWGFRTVSETRQNGMVKQEVLVVAVKKDVVEEYIGMFSKCGVVASFTLAALARNCLCPQTGASHAILDLGNNNHSELIVFDNGIPAAVRTLPWSAEEINSGAAELDSLVQALKGGFAGSRLFVSGKALESGGIPERLSQLPGVGCETIKTESGEGRSAAILGMKKSAAESGTALVLLQTHQRDGRSPLARPATLKLAGLAAGLACALLLLPYAEAIVLKPLLAHRITVLNAKTNQLATLDREFKFLQSLKQSQPPYLDALFLFAKCAPQGVRIDSLTMNRRGEVSWRGSMRNGDQVTEFRTKLIDSGFFSAVGVEEQTPTPNRQKVNVRMTAVWKPFNERQTLAIGPTAKEIKDAKGRDMPRGGMMPPGMPVGIPMPAGFPAGRMPAGLSRGRPPSGAVSSHVIRSSSSMPPGLPANLPPGVHISIPPGGTPVVLPPNGRESHP